MKQNVNNVVAVLLAKVARGVVKANVNSCCMYVMYQPKLPAGAEKMKKGN